MLGTRSFVHVRPGAVQLDLIAVHEEVKHAPSKTARTVGLLVSA